MSKAEAKKKDVTPRMLQILRAPLITEKSTMGSQYGQVTFKVPMDACKPEIKAAVETIYKVKVKAVNTSILPGKTKRFRGIEGTRSDVKKAIVTLEKGQNIDLGAGV
jgi:large subunit ribosomal protein L23